LTEVSFPQTQDFVTKAVQGGHSFLLSWQLWAAGCPQSRLIGHWLWQEIVMSEPQAIGGRILLTPQWQLSSSQMTFGQGKQFLP